MHSLFLPARFAWILALTGLFFNAPALAWNAAGHRLVALIAWEQMRPESRAIAAQLLDQHPDRQRWLIRGESGEVARTLFLEASTWADEIRDDPRYFDEASEVPTSPIPGLPDQARHRSWHYLDLPARGDQHASDGQIDRQLSRLLTVLRSGDDAARRHALPWVIHLVADIHQPLHVGSRDGEGGNRFHVVDAAHPRFQETSLHRWWDDLPGPPWLRGEKLLQAAERLRAGQAQVAIGSVAEWREESRQLAHLFAYPAEHDDPPAPISADFSARAHEIARQRLYAAGVRLGHLLDKLLVSRETR